MNSKTKGTIAILFATFLYGFYGILSRLLGDSFDLFFQFWARNLVLALIVAIPLTLNKSWKRINKRSGKWFLLRSVAGIIGSVLVFIAFNHLEIGTTIFIFYAGSLIGGYIIGRIIFKEYINFLKLTALFMSFAGLYLIYTVNVSPDKLFYLMIAFISGVGTAGWNTFSKKVSEEFSNDQVVFIDAVIFLFILFFVSLFLGEKWETPHFNLLWLYNLLFVLMLLGVNYFVVYGFKRLEAQIGSLLMLTEVIFAIIFGYLIFDEVMGMFTLVGGSLIIMAMIIPETNYFKIKRIVCGLLSK